MISDEEKKTVAVPLVWGPPDDVPVFFANQFGIQIEAGVLLVTLGQVTPPLFTGDDSASVSKRLAN